MKTTSVKLSIKEKFGYGLGDTASHFVWDMVGFWIMFFYTDVYGISPVAAGTIMLIARFWDAISDPIMGVIADRTKTKWGKFRPYILWMSIPYSVLAVLTFTTPDLGQHGKEIYAGVTYLLLMTLYTAINLPYSSLGAVMTSNSLERTSLNSYRFVAAFVGQLVVSGTALTMANYFGDGDKSKGFQTTVIIFSAISLVFFLVTFYTTRERIKPPKEQKSDFFKDFKALINNKPWLILLTVGLVSFIMFALQNTVTAYYFKYYIGNEELSQVLNISGSIALIVAIMASKKLTSFFGKRKLFILSSLVSGFFFCLLFIPGEKDTMTIYIINILAKVTYAPAVPLIWTMLADTADYSEWQSGRRSTGLIFSASTFAQKAGWGIGAGITGWLLGYYGFQADAVQTEMSITGIKLIFSVFPGLLYMSCGILIYFYNIDEKMTERIQADLEERKKD